jgi:hypothetical protein
MNKSVCSRNRMYTVVFPHNWLDSTKHWIYAAYINKSSCLQCIIYYKQLEVRTIITIILSSLKINLIRWVIVALSVVDRDFEHRSGPAKDYKIAICGLPATVNRTIYWYKPRKSSVSLNPVSYEEKQLCTSDFYYKHFCWSLNKGLYLKFAKLKWFSLRLT